MTDDVALIDALAKLLEGLTLENVLVGAVGMLVIIVGVRAIRDRISPLEALGFRNGYAKEATFLAATADIKTLIEQKAEAEGRRMDKHGQAIVELREQVGELGVKVAKVEGKLEQYRN